MFLCVRALTSAQEMRLEVRKKKVTFYEDGSSIVSLFQVFIPLVKGTPSPAVKLSLKVHTNLNAPPQQTPTASPLLVFHLLDQSLATLLNVIIQKGDVISCHYIHMVRQTHSDAFLMCYLQLYGNATV